MRLRFTIYFALVLSLVLNALPRLASADAPQQPSARVYREIEGQKLNAFVFLPQNPAVRKKTSAVLLFHGGAWVMGSAQWTYETARHFAGLGLVAFAVDYRLSKGKITPIEALDDTRAAFRWVRQHAGEFHVDPKRVAGYGVSAGGQLVAVAALVDSPEDRTDGASSKPNLLLLWSPAVDAPAELLPSRTRASDYSPLELVGASTPPTCIINGDKDTVTPLSRAEMFRDRVIKAGGICELHVYPGVGHLLTRNLSNQLGDFDPDPRFRTDGIAQIDNFLRLRGYILN
jgi:acetyl esterase/lipase